MSELKRENEQIKSKLEYMDQLEETILNAEQEKQLAVVQKEVALEKLKDLQISTE